MKRRTLRRYTANRKSAQHHSVYVVRLDPAVAALRRVQTENPDRDPDKPCIYVGMTGLALEERLQNQRLQNHKKGVKSSYYVKRFGKEFIPELYEHLNPMPYEQACVMEQELAEELRQGKAGVEFLQRVYRPASGIASLELIRTLIQTWW